MRQQYLVIPAFVTCILKKPGAAHRLKRIKSMYKKFSNPGLLLEDESQKLKKIMRRLCPGYSEGSPSEQMEMHIQEMIVTCRHSGKLSRPDVLRLGGYFRFFINSSPSPEFQNYLLLVVFTFHFRLIESFPSQGPITSRYGDLFPHPLLQGRKANTLELAIFRDLFRNVAASRQAGTHEVYKVLYKKIDWAIACYLVRIIQLDPSFDSKPFFKVLVDRSNDHASTAVRHFPSCLSIFSYSENTLIRYGNPLGLGLVRITERPFSVGEFVPAKLLRATFTYELNEVLRARAEEKKID